MNRTGLIIALAIAAVTGLVFGLYPELDLKIAALFYETARTRFVSASYPVLSTLREISMWLVTALALPPFVALVLKLVRPHRPLLVPGRAVVFLISTLVLGPALLVNVGLKDNWGRSRPIDVPQLGGSEHFTAWWDPRGGCAKNCSFVTGDGSGAFWTLAPAALAPPAWRPLAYGAALAFGASVGVFRMAFGAHFLSDVVFAGVFVFLIIWLMHGLLYRWPRTRTTDAQIDGAMERRLTRFYGSIAALFGRKKRAES
jgi:membrane-associated PAP2 superfamily phosphatase